MIDLDEGPAYPTLTEIKQSSLLNLEAVNKVNSSYHARITSIIVIFAFAFAISSLVFVPWVQTVQGKGKVIAYLANERQQNLQSPIDGRIAHWYVKEGQKVKKNQPLCDMEDIDPLALERIKKQQQAQILKLDSYKTQLKYSQRNLIRQKKLLSTGLASARSYELSEIEVAKIQAEISKAQTDLLKIETKLSRQSSQLVLASRDGTIMRIFAAEGGVVVKKGDILATIVPDTTQRAVELSVNGNDMPLLTLGRHVRLQFEGWPALQFSGWPDVAIGTFGGVVGVIDASDDGMGNFRIIVFPDKNDTWPDTKYLRQGVRTVGWVLLDTVKLGWELWRQFNGFPPSASVNIYPKKNDKDQKINFK